jgi:DNA-binding beta-propeller fold protein YncE
MLRNVWQRAVAAAVVVVGALLCAGPAMAYVPAPGVTATPFATGFRIVEGEEGPVGVAFDAVGNLFVAEDQDLYRFGPAGGPADAAHRLNASPLPGHLAGLAFGRDGALYASLWTGRGGQIVQLDTSTGRIVRVAASGLLCPTGLAVDPVSGDLFVSSVYCADRVLRVSGDRLSTFVSGVDVDGLAFGQNGTLYLTHRADQQGYTVSAVDGTASGTPGARTGLAKVPQADGIAVSKATAPGGGPAFVVVNRRDRKITSVDLSTNAMSDLVTGGTRGDLAAAGPDGCLYATQSTEVVRVAPAGATCASAPMALEPSGVPIVPPATSFLHVTGGSRKAASCRTNRRLKVRFRAPGGIKIRRARLFVKGHYNRTVSGKALRRSVTVKRLPARRFTLTIRATTKSGRKLVVHRKFGACAGR